MTLFKQTTVIFSLFFLLMLALVLAVSFSESKEYVEDELYAKAVNGASTLAVSMSQEGGDVTKMSTLANAAFDTGYFRKIELKDMRGRKLFEKSGSTEAEVPEWFTSLIDLEAPTAAAQVSSGWRPFGILEVTSESSLAVEYLYELLLKLAALFLLAGTVGVFMIALMTKRLLEPIKRIKEQAEDVLQKRFTVNRSRSSIAEIKSVTEAMNRLVERVEDMHLRLLESTKKSRKLEYEDQLTSLYNRRYFIIKYEETVHSGGADASGSVLALRLCGTQQANTLIGYDNVDKIFKDAARAVAKAAESVEESVCARLSGIEAVALLPRTGTDEALKMAESVLKEAREAVDRDEEVKDVLYISVAVVSYSYKRGLDALLSTIDLALNDAASRSEDAVKEIACEKAIPLKKSEWRRLILEAFDSSSMIPRFFEMEIAKDSAPSALLTFDLPIGEAEPLPYPVYAPMLSRVELFGAYVRYAVEYLLGNESVEYKNIVLPMPLSYIDTTHEMEYLLDSASKLKKMGISLSIELLQSEITRQKPDDLSVLFGQLHEKGVDIGVAGFDADERMLGLLKSMHPAYLKMSGSRFLDMSERFRDSLLLLLKSVDAVLIVKNGENGDRIEEMVKEEGVVRIV